MTTIFPPGPSSKPSERGSVPLVVVIAVVNQKGGVGKTTVTLGLAGAATARGLSTLVIDLDPQANATSGLGVFDPADTTVGEALLADEAGALAAVLMKAAWPDDRPSQPDLAASSAALAVVESRLAEDALGSHDRLALALQGDRHDLVLIDCPPSVGLLTVNGLFAADRALVVTEPSAWATDAVTQILHTVKRVGQRRSGKPKLVGIAVNRLGRTRDMRYWHEELATTHGTKVLPPISLRAALAEAAAQALPVDALGRRPGAAEAAAEMSGLLDACVPASLRARRG